MAPHTHMAKLPFPKRPRYPCLLCLLETPYCSVMTSKLHPEGACEADMGQTHAKDCAKIKAINKFLKPMLWSWFIC